MVSGFTGPGGYAQNLVLALRNQGAKGLTIIICNLGLDYPRVPPPGFDAEKFVPIGILVENGQVKKGLASWAIATDSSRPGGFEKAYRAGKVELEVMPQGTLAERIRAGGAGIGAFYSPVGVGTFWEQGKEKRVINGREYLLEHPLKADFALIKAYKADRMGNLVYKGTARSFAPVMATAARVTVVEVDEIVETGELDPELIITPGLFVHRIVKVDGR